jgi:short-subunit dehydrogenase
MAVYYASKAYVLRLGQAIGYELRRTGVTVTTVCPGPTVTEFAHTAHADTTALFNGPMPVMSAAEVARLGYAAMKSGRPVVITGAINKLLAISTRFTPTSLLLSITSYMSRSRIS